MKIVVYDNGVEDEKTVRLCLRPAGGGVALTAVSSGGGELSSILTITAGGRLLLHRYIDESVGLVLDSDERITLA